MFTSTLLLILGAAVTLLVASNAYRPLKQNPYLRAHL